MWLPAVNLNMQRSVKSSYGVTFLHFEMYQRIFLKHSVNLCGNMGIILWPAELWIQGCMLALSATSTFYDAGLAVLASTDEQMIPVSILFLIFLLLLPLPLSLSLYTFYLPHVPSFFSSGCCFTPK